MHEYIQKIVDELERDYEPSEWVESILKEMQNIAIRETDAKWQAKVEELQRRNQMLNDNIKEQGQKLVYQNEVIETQAEKLLGLRDEKAELQKRVDAAKQLIEDLNKCYQQDHQNKFEYWRGFADSAGILGKRLEQALKGEGQ